MRTTCKQCEKPLSQDLINNHYEWCNRKCRSEWILGHNQKGMKKKYSQPIVPRITTPFDCDGYPIDDLVRY